ncbi:uncharacterized protein LOC105181719 [Harpegnathos saltator]|uniref:uncharacterized protein LOC105181719 n=1 Tax=Harpegnathos saltator TaxID=610380 RepID=UPI000DBEE633|nr:uncharacterized protein LOC105181719 [Harpegnathos saltator]
MPPRMPMPMPMPMSMSMSMNPVFGGPGPMRQRLFLPPRPAGVSRPNGLLPLFPGFRARGMVPGIIPPMGPRGIGPRNPMRHWYRRIPPPPLQMPSMRPRFPVGNGNIKGKAMNNTKKVNKLEELELKKPWMTDEIRTEIQKKNKLYAKAKKNKDAVEWDEFKDLRNKVTRMIRDAKNEYLAKHPGQAHLYPDDEKSDDQEDEIDVGSEDDNSYYEVCDKDFSSENAFTEHRSTHKLCGIDGCTFAAHPLLVEKHYQQYATVLRTVKKHMKALSSVTLETIESLLGDWPRSCGRLERELRVLKEAIMSLLKLTKSSTDTWEERVHKLQRSGHAAPDSQVTPLIQKQNTQLRENIPFDERLSVTLRHLATGENQESLSLTFRLDTSTISGIIKEVLRAILTVLKEKFLRFPNTEDEWCVIANHFGERWDFHHVIEAMDGKHSLIDANLRFIYVDVETNSRVSDSVVWNNYSLKKHFNNNTLHILPPAPLPGSEEDFPFMIIGAEGFLLSQKLLIPYPGPQCSRRIDRRIFNYRLSRARRCAENAFGVMVAIEKATEPAMVRAWWVKSGKSRGHWHRSSCARLYRGRLTLGSAKSGPWHLSFSLILRSVKPLAQCQGPYTHVDGDRILLLVRVEQNAKMEYSIEDAKKWVEERKKRFPTKSNIMLREAENLEKLQRGETIQQNQSVFKTMKTTNMRRKKRKPRRQLAHKTNNSHIDETYRGLRPFPGINILQEEESLNETSLNEQIEQTVFHKEIIDNISDEDDDIPQTFAKSKPANLSIFSLVANYETEEEDAASEEIPIEKVQTENLQDHKTAENTVHEETYNDAQSCTDASESKLNYQIIADDKSQHPSIKYKDKPKHNTHQIVEDKRQEKVSNRHHNKLLQMLLSRSIQHERNLISQCLKYIVDDNFFESPKS